MRARNFNSDKLKVNDKRGNPVEIAAVIVWRVEDTAKAAFDVDDFENYVQIQSESAIRHIASLYSLRSRRRTTANRPCATAPMKSRRVCRPNCRCGSRRPA